ncbi:MAG: sensor histidine kinase [Clostridia bacterium]|jgi:anti-sigma regulatory factor (Ser/Thr protein kinase)|nr:sensor histidine kinase [Clostridia bacterium]
MNELSLYILDLVQNSVTAGAKHIVITVHFDTAADTLEITISDDGCGMSRELLERVTSPFTTTRKTRKVGLGIPMIMQLTEMCEGKFDIQSRPGEGTKLTLGFQASHVDLPPMGSLSETMLSLVNGTPEGIEFTLDYRVDGRGFDFSTEEVRQMLEGVPLNTPEVLSWIRDYIQQNIDETQGGGSPQAEQ